MPLKGIAAQTEAHLEALVAARVPDAVEYLFVMATADDPAYPLCRHVQARHPECAIQVLLAGPAGGRMGKQHNLAAAAQAARHAVLGSMDADVCVEPDTLAAALARLTDPRVGAAYLQVWLEPSRSGKQAWPLDFLVRLFYPDSMPTAWSRAGRPEAAPWVDDGARGGEEEQSTEPEQPMANERERERLTPHCTR